MRWVIVSTLLISFIFSGLSQNSNVSEGFVFDGEPNLAMNPNNPQHLVVAWMGFKLGNQLVIKTRVTKNGGVTWSPTQSFPHVSPGFSSADPTMEFDNQGNLYLAYIDFDREKDTGAVYMRKSVDGGYAWGNAVEVVNMMDDPGKYPIDRPWMAVDCSSGEYDGNIYITSMSIKGASAPFHPYIHISKDGGQSFSSLRYLDTADWLSGNIIPQPMPTPAVGSNGTFFTVYPSYVFSQKLLPQYVLVQSTNGGVKFDYNTVYSTAENFDDSLAKKGYLLRTDPSSPDRMVFCYLSAILGSADIMLMESKDGGKNWNPAIRINDDNPNNQRMQDLVWADFNSRGDLIVSWRDRRFASQKGYQTEYEIWGAFWPKDSSGFLPNFKISSEQSDYEPVLDGAGNDFMDVELYKDTLYAVWGDTRNSSLNIWLQKMAMGKQMDKVQNLGVESPELLVYPNPFSDHFSIDASFQLKKITVVNSSAQVVETRAVSGFTAKTLSEDWSLGIYILTVEAENGFTWTKQIVKED